MLVPLLIVVAVIVVVGVAIAMQPGDFRVSRSTGIAAPPARVFPHVNDLHRFQEWSPWAKRDPACKTTFEGPQSGAGAASHWAGNNQVGEGRMTITDSRPFNLVRIRLDFVKPFKATNTAEFTFQAQGGQTVVTWSMFGDKNFLTKAIGLVMSMDKMVGRDFEKGLADLKAIVESEAARS